MKKISAIFCALLCVLLIGGCSFGGSQQNRQSHPSDHSSSAQAEQNSSSEADSSSSADTPSASSTSSSAEKNASAADLLAQIRGRLKGRDDLRLPRTVPVAGGHYLSAQVHSRTNGYTVTFKQTDRVRPLNDAALNQAETVVSIKAITYENHAAAEKQLNYHKYSSSDGSPVDLGYHITGYRDAGAGTAGISWNEGRWSLAVLSPTADADKGVALAKQVVKKLETIALPAPQRYGRVQLYTDDNQDFVSWQNGKTIYTLTDTADSSTLLSIAATVK
ncbi:MAG: hypothetical protein LKI80_08800 [Sporolactobacillus sp.]|jgi:hypothetical protein|nr:hypothetical protein [Sporolactobacillus sp.]